jgi:hypothetical protein
MRTIYFAGFAMVACFESSVCKSSDAYLFGCQTLLNFFSNNLVNESVFGKRSMGIQLSIGCVDAAIEPGSSDIASVMLFIRPMNVYLKENAPSVSMFVRRKRCESCKRPRGCKGQFKGWITDAEI